LRGGDTPKKIISQNKSAVWEIIRSIKNYILNQIYVISEILFVCLL